MHIILTYRDVCLSREDLYHHRNDPHHRNDLRHRNDPPITTEIIPTTEMIPIHTQEG